MSRKREFFPNEVKRKAEFNCNNRCRGNCCSELFLELNELNEKRLKEKRELLYFKEYTDWKWVDYHFGLSTSRYGKEILVTLDDDVEYEILFNPHINSNMVLIHSACKMLRKDNKCKIFRARPKVCRIAECPVFSGKKNIEWYAQHTELKELLKDGISNVS